MYYTYNFGLARVCTPFTREATKIICSIIHRMGYLLRDASDTDREKTVIIRYRGFKIEVNISFNSGPDYIVKLHLDPRGNTVMKIKKIKRWRRINRLMELAE